MNGTFLLHRMVTPFSKIFYASDKEGSYDLWMADKKGNGWVKPIKIDAINDTTSNEWLPSVTNKGNLYFESDRVEGKGGTDIYMSKLMDSKFTPLFY
jgi:peptidoglycan-associated lipoprotein